MKKTLLGMVFVLVLSGCSTPHLKISSEGRVVGRYWQNKTIQQNRVLRGRKSETNPVLETKAEERRMGDRLLKRNHRKNPMVPKNCRIKTRLFS